MRKLKITLVAATVAAGFFAGVPARGAEDVADKQGFCKKQNSDCNGASECAGPHASLLPPGQEKRC